MEYTAVFCFNSAESFAVLERMEQKGYDWIFGLPATSFNPINEWSSNKCLSVHGSGGAAIQYCSLEYYRNAGYEIITADQYLKL